MDTHWVDVAKQVPSLGVLVWLVVYFLRHMKEMSESTKDIASSCHDFQKELTNENHAVMNRMASTLDKNTDALGRALFIMDKHARHGGQ